MNQFERFEVARSVQDENELHNVQESDPVKMNPLNFRKKLLDQFNGARRILASGDISKLLEVLSAIEKFDILFRSNLFGPASDMKKLVWNRQLEQASWEYIQNNGVDLKKFGGTLHYKDYIGFHWMGDIWALMDLLLKAFPGDAMKKVMKQVKTWMELLEKLIILIWMGLCMPKTIPIPKGEEFSAAEALYGNRFEIGCYSNLIFSVCFVKKLPYQKRMFTAGAACSRCETNCEIIRNEEGEDEIGELCVPPSGFYTQQQEEMKALETSFSSSIPIILITFLVIFLALRK
ncbi:hypothetical protein CRE_28708 [Caenorhabditis remanei]|uniref:Uncharacterized protein n=1 Tax=Caenorhabditis remanei TaxID=31234 RepID=E3MK47_CAERE|nr:hypothetical protein CRE_28708 [Caenorhabditis remanei]